MTHEPSFGTVLIVDDDVDIREILSQALREEGYHTASAPSVAEALTWLRGSRRPTMILLDLMMPGMDGWGFCAEQSRDPAIRDIPVVVLSADATVDARLRRLGAAGHLRKPVALDALLEMVREVCARDSGCGRA